MKAAWKEYRFGDCVTLLSGGTPSKSRNDYWEGDLPWVSCKDMKVDRIYDAEDHLSSLGAENGTRVVPENTILFVVRGMILAKEFPVAITKRPVAFNQDLKAVNCADFVQTEFLYYWLKANRHEILGRADEAGHGTKRIQTDRLLSLPIQIPAPLVQRQIVGILSAYDDLIANNQRRIKILEEMARSLYREWFVHFRFPGHKKVKMVPSAIGIIPQGWEVKQLGELATVTMGLSPKGDTYNEEENGMPLVNGPVEFGDRFTKRMKWTTEPTKFCKEGDLVVCVRGSTTGKYVKSDGVYCLGRGVCGISSQHQCFIELLFENELPTLLSQTSGSTFPSWTGPQLKSHPVVAPPAEILGRFDALVKPMSVAVFAYSRQIQNLRRTRDLLLPRLLAGQMNLGA